MNLRYDLRVRIKPRSNPAAYHASWSVRVLIPPDKKPTPPKDYTMKAKLNSFLVLLALSSAAQAATQYTSNPGTWNLANLNWSAAATPGGPYTSALGQYRSRHRRLRRHRGHRHGGSQNLNVGRPDLQYHRLRPRPPLRREPHRRSAATIYNLAAAVTAAIGANVTLQSAPAANQNWNLKGAQQNHQHSRTSTASSKRHDQQQSLLDGHHRQCEHRRTLICG